MNKNIQEIKRTNITSNITTNEKDCFHHSEDLVTTKQFLKMIKRASKGGLESINEIHLLEYIDNALHKGIIEDYDIMNMDRPIERRAVARIVHQVLLNELGEKDEDEWPAAKDLIDLYSCRTCVIHIAQVYVKGIMLSSKDDIFDHRGSIDYDEAQSIITRLFDREQRIPKLKGKEFKVEQLSPDEAKKLILDDNTAIIVDVRSKEEYDTGHIEGSINIPLQKISNNPFMVCVNMNTPIILYCNMRYKSSIAAELLIDVGYSRVYTIPGVEQYDYF